MMRLQSLISLISSFSVIAGNVVASAPAVSSRDTPQQQLEYLFQANVTTGERIDFGSGPGPLGTRVSFPIIGGSFTGPELSGEVLNIGADWGLIDAKGTFSVNAYYQLRTSDNVNIFAHSNGPTQSDGRIHTHITLETGDEKYYWVNNILVVGVTTVGDGFITLDAWQMT